MQYILLRDINYENSCEAKFGDEITDVRPHFRNDGVQNGWDFKLVKNGKTGWVSDDWWIAVDTPENRKKIKEFEDCTEVSKVLHEKMKKDFKEIKKLNDNIVTEI